MRNTNSHFQDFELRPRCLLPTTVTITIYIYIYIYIYCCTSFSNFNWAIGLMGRVFANGPVEVGSISGRVIPKTKKIVFGVALYKVWIKGKMELSRERSSALPYTMV